MADRSVATTDTIETLRTTFNSLAGDIGDISDLTGASGVIASSTDVVEAVTALNTEISAIKAGTAVFETKLTFEGDTDDAHETVLQITDPTADRVITFPDATGTVVTTTATQTLTNKTLTSPTLTSAVLNTAVSGSAFLDEDGMDSNSATKLASQQSIKAYVDAQITAQDLDITSVSGTIAIDLDSETLTIAGGTGISTSGSSNQITIATSADVVTLTGTQTLTNKTLTSPVMTTPQINDSSADHQYVFAVSELTADRTVTLPLLTGNDQITMDAHTSTLTNKTIDLASNTVTGSLAEFNTALQSESFAGLAATQTLTNNTISGADNTLSNIANSSLTNSGITFGDGSSSTATSLGGTITFSGTNNEVEVAESSGTVTVGLPAATQVTTSLGIGGGSTNGVVISQGAISIKNGGTQSYIDFYCESSNAHYARLQAPAHGSFSGNHTITLPATAGTPVSYTHLTLPTNREV